MPAHKSVFINDIVSPKGRFAFPHLAKPDEGGQYSDGKFKVTLLIPKDSDMTALKQAIGSCAREAWGGKVKPKDLCHMPLRDGDEKTNLDGYAGCWYVTAKSSKRRRIVDRKREDIAPEDAYGGCEGRLVLTAMSYEQGGKPGVTFLLDTVQKLGEGQAFGGGGGNVSILDDGEFDEKGSDPTAHLSEEAPDNDDGDDEDDWMN